MKPEILIVDDESSHRAMLNTVLTADGYDVFEADDGERAVSMVEERFFNLILMDIRMVKMDGLMAQKRIRRISPKIPVIMMTAFGSVDTAVEAMKAGAADYITKPIDIDMLKISIEKALSNQQLKEENIQLKDRLESTFSFSDIIGKSRPMKQMFDTLRLVAPSDASVLILGESGTGKELIANAIHHNSPRREKNFIKVNCAALPEALLESELFGHEKGAFTGAVAKKKGRFVLADQGSVFLDEIAEMALPTQAKILRVLQEQEFEPVGGTQTIKVNTRVITATNRVLKDEVERGAFREDLYYRLNVVELNMPPLRERGEDIPLLADHFLKKYAQKNKRRISGFNPLSMDILMRHEWPGNVRELENVIERSVIMAKGDVIRSSDLPASLKKGDIDVKTDRLDMTPGRLLKDIEREMILITLEETGGNRTHASRILGISRRTLQLKLKDYGINPKTGAS